MKTTLTFILLIPFGIAGHSQVWEGHFEEPELPSTDTAWFGQDQITDGDTIYYNSGWDMELNYNASWGSYTGWAVSNWTDDTTPGWGNQFSAITGSGHFSDQYGVCYETPFSNERLFFEFGGVTNMFGMYVTNTTYAYYSMLNGDSFAKKFGEDTSATGVIDGTNGEDWFLLTVYGLDTDSLYTGDSVNFYLADYRFSDDSEDYIIDEWTYVSLSSLGEVHGLDFVLSSSDTTGGFGMNTPAYFAMDDFSGGWASLAEEKSLSLTVYPNPTTNRVQVETEIAGVLELSDLRGRVVYRKLVSAGTHQIDMNHLAPGMYNLIARFDDHVLQERIIKE